MMPYERLKAWEACHALWIAVFHSTQSWPASERYGIAAQIKRAALSAGANIAEGIAKRGQRDCARQVNIAIGSLAEVAYMLRAARDVGILKEQEYDHLLSKQQTAGRLTMLLYKGLRRTLQ